MVVSSFGELVTILTHLFMTAKLIKIYIHSPYLGPSGANNRRAGWRGARRPAATYTVKSRGGREAVQLFILFSFQNGEERT